MKIKIPEFLPTTKKEMDRIGWKELDVLLVSGDAYVDHPSFAAALLGKWLTANGFRTGIIAQPDWRDPKSLTTMGHPRLCAGISAGNLDSMVSHYTSLKKKRRDDAYSPGGRHGLRPNRAAIVYTSLVRSVFKGLPVIIGGVEASLRRLAHYDYWDDAIRRSLLFDSKADVLIYGMGETPLLEIVQLLDNSKPDFKSINSTCYSIPANDYTPLDNDTELPSYEELKENKDKLLELHRILNRTSPDRSGARLIQRHGERLLIVNPPAAPLDTNELDYLYSLPFARRPHPVYKKERIPAFDMIRGSVTALRGCPGGCSFCALGLHQGRFIRSRSRESVLSEIAAIGKQQKNAIITDVGGPTANLYGSAVRDESQCSVCRRPSCLYPSICGNLDINAREYITLLNKAAALPDIKQVFVGSGLRHDAALRQPGLIEALVTKHVSGRLKIAPEYFDDAVLKLMRKPSMKTFSDFLDRFQKAAQKAGKNYQVIPYLIAGFPGATTETAKQMMKELKKRDMRVEQVQDYIPLPMTEAAAMWYCEKDLNGKPLHVAKSMGERRLHRSYLQYWKEENKKFLK